MIQETVLMEVPSENQLKEKGDFKALCLKLVQKS